MLAKSLKLQQFKNKKGSVKNTSKLCAVVGCVFSFRTEKQKEVSWGKWPSKASFVLVDGMWKDNDVLNHLYAGAFLKAASRFKGFGVMAPCIRL